MNGKRILVAQGVNLDLLGRRETDIYGQLSPSALEAEIQAFAVAVQPLYPSLAFSLSFFQTNHEGLFLDELSRDWDGIIINPGAWTHQSLALGDRLRGLGTPFIEVHLSNIAAREAYRHHSYSAPHARGVVYGLGVGSYKAALVGLLAIL